MGVDHNTPSTSSSQFGLPACTTANGCFQKVSQTGGTSLTFNSNGTFANETGWASGGGGCSAYETANAAQAAFESLCGTKRATPDVSLDADPASGVSVYDSAARVAEVGLALLLSIFAMAFLD